MPSRSHSCRSIFAGLIAAAAVVASPVSAQPCSPAEVSELLATDGVAIDRFGGSVSVSGNTAVIGAIYDDDNGFNSGSVYVYRFDGASWAQEAKLLAADGAADDHFGSSVSVSGDTAVISAVSDADNGIASGSVYVFRFNGTSWVQEAKLLAADGAVGDNFGSSVSVTGSAAVIGSVFDDDNGDRSGSAYVFRFNGTSWVQEAKLLPDDGANNDQFGLSVSVSGNTAVIGAWQDDDNGNDSGSAYIYRFDGKDWDQEAKLLPNDGAATDRFGYSVSGSGDSAVIGSVLDDDNGSASGSAYLFRFDGINWVQEAKLLPDDGAAGDQFGGSVSVSGDSAVIGAVLDDVNGSTSGSAYLFRFDGAGWVQEDKLLPADGVTDDRFGGQVAVSGDIAVIGAVFHDDNGFDAGSAYIFDLNCTAVCLADVNHDGMLTAADFSAWIAAFNAGDPGCDQNGDGACTPADFTAWIANFNAGCP